MLLVDDLLVADVWCHRETVEREAADHFDRLAVELAATGAPAIVVDLAAQAGDDEREHAVMCRALIDGLAPDLEPVAPTLGGTLGPRSLSREHRALYASVAIGCVTETLSAALLLEMRRLAQAPGVADTVHRILTDEVRHSRLGWAHLAWAAERGDVSWLGPHIDGMLADAVRDDLLPATRTAGAPSHGVLPSASVRAIVRDAIDAVIRPGLAGFGISSAGSASSARQ